MDTRFILNKNKNLQLVPNFVKLNAQRTVHSIDISHEMNDQLSNLNSSVMNLSLVRRSKKWRNSQGISQGSMSPAQSPRYRLNLESKDENFDSVVINDARQTGEEKESEQEQSSLTSKYKAMR